MTKLSLFALLGLLGLASGPCRASSATNGSQTLLKQMDALIESFGPGLDQNQLADLIVASFGQDPEVDLEFLIQYAMGKSSTAVPRTDTDDSMEDDTPFIPPSPGADDPLPDADQDPSRDRGREEEEEKRLLRKEQEKRRLLLEEQDRAYQRSLDKDSKEKDRAGPERTPSQSPPPRPPTVGSKSKMLLERELREARAEWSSLLASLRPEDLPLRTGGAGPIHPMNIKILLESNNPSVFQLDEGLPGLHLYVLAAPLNCYRPFQLAISVVPDGLVPLPLSTRLFDFSAQYKLGRQWAVRLVPIPDLLEPMRRHMAEIQELLAPGNCPSY